MNTGPKLGTNELLFRRAQQMGLAPSWLTPNGVFAINLPSGGGIKYINGGRSPLNSHVSSSLAKNKYLTRMILGRNGMSNIPFARFQALADAQSFLKRHRKIVAKPVAGAGAVDINIITDNYQLNDLSLNHYIFEKYIAGQEMRYLVLNDSVIGVHRSDYGTSVAVDRPLERISYPRSSWDRQLVTSARQIARILELHFAAIDFIIDEQGTPHILEVNTNPGLKWFHAPTSGPIVDVAGLFLESIVEDERQTTESVQLDNEPSQAPASLLAYL